MPEPITSVGGWGLHKLPPDPVDQLRSSGNDCVSGFATATNGLSGCSSVIFDHAREGLCAGGCKSNDGMRLWRGKHYGFPIVMVGRSCSLCMQCRTRKWVERSSLKEKGTLFDPEAGGNCMRNSAELSDIYSEIW